MRKPSLSQMSNRKCAQFGLLGVTVMAVSMGAFLYACFTLLSRDFLQGAITGYSRGWHEGLYNNCTRCDCVDGDCSAVDAGLTSPKMRILLGVFSVASKVERRNLLRIAYGVQTTEVAQVTLTFVLGKLQGEEETLAVRLEALHHGDIMIVDCEENINHGKSFKFFSAVAAIGVHYDYVMKVDDDSYVRVENLAKSLDPLPREDLYYGYVLPCENQDPYAWYMAGMGYLLSWDLVEWVHESPIPRNATDGTEDMLLGGWLNAGKKAKHRVNKKPLFYDHPEFGGKCAHELIPETILVHQVKNDKRWHDILAFFEGNRFAGLVPAVAPAVASAVASNPS